MMAHKNVDLIGCFQQLLAVVLYVRVLCCFGENAIANVRAGSMFPIYVSGRVRDGYTGNIGRGLDEEVDLLDEITYILNSEFSQLRTI